MDQIKRPTLIIDKRKCLSNIQKMAARARESAVIFRPHFKTHQSPRIAEWFKPYGVEKICVSSLEMAESFAGHGWSDITIAFPVNYRQIEEINMLNSRINLNLLIESPDSLVFLRDNLREPAGIFMEIDAGHHRSGMSSLDHEGIDEMLRYMAAEPKLDFQGFLIHSGNTYKADSIEVIKSIYSNDLNELQALKQSCKYLFPGAIISMGDTPSCSIIKDLDGVDEIRPGNFIFYDLMQLGLGVCAVDEIAVAVACPVVAKNEGRNELVIYGGAVHLSKESLADPDGTAHYGLVVQFQAHGWSRPLEKTRICSLSQEHGIIKTTAGIFKSIERGHILGILPVHSCLTNDLLLNNSLVINERY